MKFPNLGGGGGGGKNKENEVYWRGEPPLQWKLKLLVGNHSLQHDSLPGRCLVSPPLVAVVTLHKSKGIGI